MSKATEVEGLEGVTIPAVIASLEAQIKALGKIETSKFKTSMNLAPFGDLKKEKKVETLVRAYSLVRGKSKAYNESAEELNGVEGLPTFKEDGNTLAEWKEDIELQIQIATQSDRLAELKKLLADAKQFVSEEDKRAMFMKSLTSSAIFTQGVAALGAGTGK